MSEKPGHLFEDDVFTLIGHAEYLRAVKGQSDMPAYFLGLAERIAMSMGDTALADRCREMREALPLRATPVSPV